MSIPVPQQRKLLQRSGNMCAFPDCRLLLTVEVEGEDRVVTLGEIAHIVAESPDGPRGESALTLKQRNTYPNLILLCNQHHQLIDSAEAVATYTVARLTAMREDHEKSVERILGGRRNVSTPDLPPPVRDTVYSNLFRVQQLPRYIYGAPTSVKKESDVRPAATAESTMTPFIIRGGWLWAFQDLRDPDGPFRDVVTTSETEQHVTRDWYQDPERLGWFVALLNRCLNKLTGRLGLRFDRDHHRYYFEADQAGQSLEVTYRPLNKNRATRSVVWQPKKKATGEARNYWLHRAVSLRFVQTSAGHWCLAIRPELRVTADGHRSVDSEQVGRRVTRKKSRMFNYDLLNEVNFWRDFLSRSNSTIAMTFGPSSQQLVVSSAMATAEIRWPGIPAKYAKPFANVDYLDTLFTWAEAATDLDDDVDEPQDDEDPIDLLDDEEEVNV